MGASIAIQSCATMTLSFLIGIAWGVAADHYSPVSSDSFALGGVASVIALGIESLRRFVASRSAEGALPIIGTSVALALFAVVLMNSEAFDRVDRSSVSFQVILVLPFFLAIGSFIRHRAWFAVCGATLFIAVAVAMLYCNRYGGWTGFFYVYCT
ncbi:MAG TPA: hypothetical protein VF590_07350 [Isosphaeraceae bacterium]|jgi:hypothetical protein